MRTEIGIEWGAKGEGAYSVIGPLYISLKQDIYIYKKKCGLMNTNDFVGCSNSELQLSKPSAMQLRLR